MKRLTIIGVIALIAMHAVADPTTGWKQTASGTYRFTDAANWVGGEVNGVFGADLTLNGDQTILFDADTSIDSMIFSFAGKSTLTFASDSTPRTLSLKDNVFVNIDAGSKVVFGATDDSLALNLGQVVLGLLLNAAMSTLEARFLVRMGLLLSAVKLPTRFCKSSIVRTTFLAQ